MFVLHGANDSASTIVRLVLEESGLAYSLRTIDWATEVRDTPAYRALQPLGLIPALETPDEPMFETAAILLYLGEKVPGLAPAPGAPDRAAFLTWWFFTSTNLHPTLLALFYPDRMAGTEAVPHVLSAARSRMAQYLALLDGVAATQPGWLPAGGPSLLGYYLAILLRWLGSLSPDHPGHVRLADYPALHAVLEMLETRPAARAVAEAEALGLAPFTNPTP